ncbi:MAG: hypothetical protein ABW189_01430 [Rickettsiales bacterium]
MSPPDNCHLILKYSDGNIAVSTTSDGYTRAYIGSKKLITTFIGFEEEVRSHANAICGICGFRLNNNKNNQVNLVYRDMRSIYACGKHDFGYSYACNDCKNNHTKKPEQDCTSLVIHGTCYQKNFKDVPEELTTWVFTSTDKITSKNSPEQTEFFRQMNETLERHKADKEWDDADKETQNVLPFRTNNSGAPN